MDKILILYTYEAPLGLIVMNNMVSKQWYQQSKMMMNNNKILEIVNCQP